MTGRLRLLIGHFLQRFLDNDLVAPGGDGHLGAGNALAAVFVASLLVFVTVTLKYAQFRMTWEQVLDWSFDDAALYVAAPMILFGIAATVAWDAFYLDSRDYAALAVLPLHPRLLSAAKLAALAVFLVALTIAANLVPLLFAAPMMLRGVPGATFWQWATLGRAQAAASIGAGVWTALAIVGLRGLLGCALPVRLLRRISPVVQAALMFLFLGWMVLLPAFVRKALVAWKAGGWLRDVSPPFWFIGVHRALVGRLEPGNAPLVHAAVVALAGTVSLVLVLYLVWPARRQYGREAQQGVPDCRTSLLRRPHDAVLGWACARRPVERAAFEFTWKGCWRNGVQRLCLAAAAGAGLAWSAGAISSSSGHWTTPSPATLQAQLVLTLFAVAAVRLGVAMPVALNANWVFRVTECGDSASYQVGTRRAALAIGAWPVIVLAPVHLCVWGWHVAAYHALVGVCHAACMVELLFLASRAVPFATPHIPGRLRLKTRWAVYLFAPTVLAGAPAYLEYGLLRHGWLALLTPALLVAIASVIAVERRRRERMRAGLVFEEQPLDAILTLAIFE